MNENNATQQKILDSNSSLKTLYDELVPSILTHNEFWDSRQELLQNEANIKKGTFSKEISYFISYIDFSENQESVSGDKLNITRKHQFKVTPAFIEETFKKNPSLQTAYHKQVPLLVCTEKAFHFPFFP